MKYVGPPYRKALVMPDGLKADPSNMTAAEAKSFMKRYPGRDHYFEKPAPKKSRKTKKDGQKED